MDRDERDPWEGRTCGECRFFAKVDLHGCGEVHVCLYCPMEEGWAKVDAHGTCDQACEGFEERR